MEKAQKIWVELDLATIYCDEKSSIINQPLSPAIGRKNSKIVCLFGPLIVISHRAKVPVLLGEVKWVSLERQVHLNLAGFFQIPRFVVKPVILRVFPSPCQLSEST